MSTARSPAQYALLLIDLAEQQGCDRATLLAGTDLAGSTTEIGARIRDSDFAQLVHNALTLTGDPALGLKLGLSLNLSAHAVLGQAFLTCRNLGQVMDLFLKYYHLLAPALELEFDTLDQHCQLTTVSNPAAIPEEFSYELVYSALLNTLRGLSDRPELQLRVELPYPEPAHAEAYREAFGEDIHFDCLQGRLSFPRRLLDTPLPSSNPALRALYEQECDRLLADLESAETVTEQTLRLLRKLEGQYPQMPQLADMLNFSPRTYRRRLEAEGQSFQGLLDRVRAEHATRYLRNTDLPLSSIAYMIGLNDVSNFRRAYQRWTGRSPRQVREF